MIHILRDLGISLSSCVYQSLCDCDTVMQNCAISSNQGYNQFKAGRLTASGKRSFLSRYKDSSRTTESSTAGGASEEPLVANTPPNKWPGVQSLQAMIVREKDEDLPKLHTLLCEAIVAVYVCQLIYALTICDSSIIYRLIGLKFTDKTWADLFGGGAKKLLYVSAASAMTGLGPSPGAVSPNELPNGTASSSPHIDHLHIAF